MSAQESKNTYKVQVGMTLTGELRVKADSEEEAREEAKRMIKREPFKGTMIAECFTNNVFEF